MTGNIMHKIHVIFFIFISVICEAQIPEGYPSIDKSDLPGANILSVTHYSGESLDGYLKGLATLYREYGISDGVIIDIAYGDGHYKSEVFKLKGPAEAFGIYSVSREKCRVTNYTDDFRCQSKDRLQICKGTYYINIAYISGSGADSVLLMNIGNKLISKISETSFNPEIFIPNVDIAELKNNAILVKGGLGLRNSANNLEKYFMNLTDFEAVIFTTKEKNYISVNFNNPEDFILFINFHGWGMCDMSVTDLTTSRGETLRLLGNNHLLIRTGNN